MADSPVPRPGVPGADGGALKPAWTSGARRYTEVRESDFWTFFGLREVAEERSRDGDPDGDPAGAPAPRTVRLQTGGFQDSIELELECRADDRVGNARLRLREAWAFGPPWGVNPLALDLVRSFLRTLAPEADQAPVEQMSPPSNPQEAVALLREEPDFRNGASPFLAALAGAIPGLKLELSTSEVWVTRPVEGWVQVGITAF